MEAVVEQIPQTGTIQFTIQISAQHNYSAKAARRMVRRFVADEIGYLLRAGEPTLVIGEQICWRVPVMLALPNAGPVGTVGSIRVDVETGQLLVTPDEILEIGRHARDLAVHYPTPASSAS